MLAVADYNTLTAVLLVRHNSPPSRDYVHITGENSGCWSFVGRRGGVSSTVQGVVKTNPGLRTKPLGYRSLIPKHKRIPVYLVLPNPPPSHTNTVSNLRNVTHIPTVTSPTSNRCVLTADLDIWFIKYQFVYSKLCLGSAGDRRIVQHFVCVIPPVVPVRVATECTFICVSVGPNTCHTFLLNTSLLLFKLSAVHSYCYENNILCISYDHVLCTVCV
jgi:hypothetical protein